MTLLSAYLGSNGVFTASGVSPGRHVIRVIARSLSGKARKILRSIVYVPEDSESCRPHLINRGLNVKGNNVTLEFASTGSPYGFECILDRVYREACKSLTMYVLFLGQLHSSCLYKRIVGFSHKFFRTSLLAIIIITFLNDSCQICALISVCRSEPMDSVKSGLWLPSHSPESIWVCRECQ